MDERIFYYSILWSYYVEQEIQVESGHNLWGRQNSREPEIYIIPDDSLSRDTPSTRSSPTILNYNGSEHNG